jgi:chaperonin GroES
MRVQQHGRRPGLVGHAELGLQAEAVRRPQGNGFDADGRRRYFRLVAQKQPITMLADRVLVQIPQNEERRSRSGILIPATAEVAKRLVWAEVVAVGPHVRTIKTGDQVLFSPEDRYEVEVQGEDYLLLRERDIHAAASDRIDSSTGLYL